MHPWHEGSPFSQRELGAPIGRQEEIGRVVVAIRRLGPIANGHSDHTENYPGRVITLGIPRLAATNTDYEDSCEVIRYTAYLLVDLWRTVATQSHRSMSWCVTSTASLASSIAEW